MGRTCIKDHRPEHSLGDDRWLNGCAQCEIERLRAALAESCDEHRSQRYEAGPGGGCVLLRDAVAAERERWIVAAKAAEMAAAEAEALALDAERKALRYLWLRDADDAAWRPFSLRDACSGADADARVDAAMAGSKTPNVLSSRAAEGGRVERRVGRHFARSEEN